MKPVLEFLKKRLVPVICVLLILVFLPAGFVGSQMWNASIKEGAQSSFDAEKRTLDSGSSVSYALPQIEASEQPIREDRPPNSVVTEFYASQRAARNAQVERVVEDARALNERSHGVLIEGLLPDPVDDRTRQVLTVRMAGELSGSPGDPTTVFDDMAASINGGPPVDPESLVSVLEDYESQERDRLAAASPDGNLSQAQEEELDRELQRRRLGAYAARSNEISVYISPPAFGPPTAGPGPGGRATGRPIGRTPSPSSGAPTLRPDPQANHTIEDVFAWQFDLWFIRDILDAVGAVNRDQAGQPTPVVNSVIKRVVSVEPIPYRPDDKGQFEGLRTTHTGRASGGAGGLYDVRQATLTVVADATRLPEFVDALGRTNFLTVTSLEVSRIDPWQELLDGRLYGSSPVVRARMGIEGVYLRDWIALYMPESIRTRLNITLPEPPPPPDDQGEGP